MIRRLSIFCFILVSCSGWAAPPIQESRTLRETLTFPAGEGRRTLIVDNINGRVVVTGEDRTDVAAVIIETIEGENAEAVARAKREARLDRSPGPGRTVRLYADGPWRCGEKKNGKSDCRESWNLPYSVRYDLELKVPRDLDLDLSTVNSGELTVRGVQPRRFELANVNGDLVADGLSGAGDAATVNGELKVNFATNPSGPCRFETINGEIDLGLRRGVAAEVSAQTQNGETYSDFPVTTSAAQPVRVEAEAGGRKVYRSAQSTFRLGAGGPRLELKTINGDIVVRDLGAPRG